MKFFKEKLLWKYSVLGLLFGVGVIIPEYFLLHFKSGTGLLWHAQFNYSELVLCLYPIVFVLIFYYVGKFKISLVQSNTKLQANEQQKQALLDEIMEYKFALDESAVVSVIDENGKFKRVNKNFLQLTGYASTDVIGRAIWRMPGSLEMATIFRNIKKVTDSGKVWRGEIVYPNASGTNRYTNGIVVPLSNKEGGNNDCLVIQYDITAEKNAEIALHKAERERSVILEHTQTLICTHDVEGRITTINNAGAHMLGCEPIELIGKSISTFLPPGYTLPQYLHQVITEGVSEGYMRIIGKNGEIRSLLFKNVLSKIQGESFIIGSAIDITEKVAAQKELERQRTFIGLLIDKSPNMLMVVNEQNAIAFVNEKFKSFHGISANDEFTTVEEAIALNENIALIANINNKKCFGSSATTRYDIKLSNVNTGDSRWYKVQHTYFSDKGNNHFLLIIATDINEMHEAQQELLKAKKLVETSSKAKEQFFATISHELRTPLNSIIGFANLMDDTQLDEHQLDYMQTIKMAGKNLLHMINDILDLSKMVSGNLQLVPNVLSIGEMTKNVARLFEPRIKEKNIFLKVFVSDLIPPRLFGDEGRLNQILINLVSNAVKFTDQGGVEIVVKQVKGETAGKTYVRFAIKDTGIGIEKENCDLIFLPYSQANNEIQKFFGGTGLGLNIVKNLVVLFGGEIKVESEPGKGTVFSFVVPLDGFTGDADISADSLPEKKLKQYTRPLNILLAEDNKTNAKLATRLLEKRNFSVVHANDGLEVIKLLGERPFDLILMDVQMLKMDGLETTRIIRASNDHNANIPIIALTAHSFVGKRNVCSEAGMNSYVSKPFNPDELYLAIDDVMCETEASLLQA